MFIALVIAAIGAAELALFGVLVTAAVALLNQRLLAKASKANGEALATTQAALRRHEIQFSELHKQQAKVVADIFSKLLVFTDTARDFLSGDADAPEANNKAREELLTAFRPNIIFLKPNTADKLHTIITKVANAVSEKNLTFTTNSTLYAEERRQAQNRFSRIMSVEVPELQIQLTHDFRELLGVTSKEDSTDSQT